MHLLKPQALSAGAFEVFGEVIDLAGKAPISINQGFAQRFDDLAPVDVEENQGRAIVSLFRSRPIPLPHRVQTMERHPLGSQTFVPMSSNPFLVLVADPVDEPGLDNLHLFLSNGRQGVHYAKNTWHHFLITLKPESDFLVIDRKGPGSNLQEIALDIDVQIDPIKG